jgi:AcrR family transcriptional regulator
MVATLIRATARVLVKHGYEGTNTNRVAEVAGVSIGSLYQYFPNKEALVAALIARHKEEMWRIYEAKLESLRDASIATAARDLVRTEIAVHALDPGLHRVLIEQVPRVGPLRRVNEIKRQVTALVEAYLVAHREEVRPRDLSIAAIIVVNLVQAAAHAAVLERPELFRDERLVDETTDAVLRYLTGRGRDGARPRRTKSD